MKKQLIAKAFTLLLFLCSSADLRSQPFFAVRVNKLWGVMNAQGKVLVKPAYDNLYVYGEKNSFFTAQSGDSTFLFNSRLQIVARTTYAAIIDHGEGMFITRLRSKRYYPSFYGLMDSTGKVILEPKFSLMEPFSDGVAKVDIYIDTAGFKKENERSGIIDKKGNWIVKPVYATHHIKSSSDGLINFYEPLKGWGAMDVTTKIVIEPKYLWLGPYKFGFMEYSVNENCSGLMRKDGTPTIIDDGKRTLTYRPESAGDSLVVVHCLKFIKNDFMPYRYVDGSMYTVSGKFLYEIKYGKDCSQQCNGFFQVSSTAQMRGMMDASGRIVAEPVYDVLQWSQIGLKQIKKNKKWGFINDEGKEVISCIYDDTKPFDCGLAAVYVGGTWSDYIFPDRNPTVKMGYINDKGEIIWEPSW